MLALLTPAEKRKMFWLFAAILIMALLEVVGVASIMPFIAVLTKPQIIEENRFLHWVYYSFGFANYNNYLIALGLLVLVALVLSNAFTAATNWAMLHFTYMKQYAISRRLLIGYINRPYTFFLNRNSADLGKNILYEVSQVVGGVFVPGIEMVARLVVTVFIVSLLFIAEPVLAIVVITILGGSYAIGYALVQRKLSKLGKIRLITNRDRYKITGEIFQGIKDVKVLGREGDFVKRYSESTRRFSRAHVFHQVISLLPKYVMESIAFGGILILVLYFLMVKNEVGKILPLAALYTLAGYRVMPALQQIFRSMTQIKFNMPAVDVLYNDFINGATIGDESVKSEGVEIISSVENSGISLRDVTFIYPGSDKPAVKNINVNILQNSIVAFVGPTGSGKTTLIDIILGLLWPQEGFLTVGDVNIWSGNVRDWQKRLGYVPQHIYLTDDSIKRNIALGLSDGEIDNGAVERAAKIANIDGFVDGLRNGFHTIIGERGVRLSGGQRQRIGIARALYHDPDVLIMDEGTSALDGITEEEVMSAISNLSHKKTIILVAHRLTTVKDSDVIYLMDKGQILDHGTYDNLILTNPQFCAMARLVTQRPNLDNNAG